MTDPDQLEELNAELTFVYRYLRKLGITHEDAQDVDPHHGHIPNTNGVILGSVFRNRSNCGKRTFNKINHRDYA